MASGIALAASLQFAWPPMPSGTFTKTENSDTVLPGYPLRVALPDAEPLPAEELAGLIADHTAPADKASEMERASPTASNRDLAGITDKEPGLALATPVQLRPGEFIAVDYDIGTLEPVSEKLDRKDGSLTVSKPLLVDGVAAGSATIRIEEGAQILISASAVAKALGPKAESLPKRISTALAKGSGFIPFYELRGAGISVVYDPVRDRVAMSTPS